MIPMASLPGYSRWSAALEALREHPGALWLCGDTGTGLTTLASYLAAQRQAPLLDDADRLDAKALEAWISHNPRGVLAAHSHPDHPALAAAASRCLAFRLPTLEEDPAAVAPCLQALAATEGLQGPLPPALATLPCPGNLRGLRNRLVRWKLLGQLPEEHHPGGPALPLEAEDLASNLHVLERLLLHRALRRSYGNRVEAAKRLGVSRRQLYLLIARHGDPVRGEAPSQEGPKRLSKRLGKIVPAPPPNPIN